MAQITLNGNKKEIQEGMNLDALLGQMELPKFFVVEKNLEIIYKENYSSTVLSDGDVLEIAAFCGGG